MVGLSQQLASSDRNWQWIMQVLYSGHNKKAKESFGGTFHYRKL